MTKIAMRTMLLGVACSPLLWSTMAAAQAINPPAAAVSNDDIVVTANKRSERAQDVAMSITAVSGDELNDRRLLDIQDLATRVPGLSFQRGGNGPSQRIVLRGLSTGGGSLSVDGPTVASVVDDVPISFSSGTSAGASFAADFDPYDLQRIEVLKGPQGTLYGATAEGGLIKYVTNLPDTQAFSGGFDSSIISLKGGNRAGGSLKAYLNAPLATDRAAIRVSGYYEDTPGWISNRLGNGGSTTTTNASQRFGGRASILFKPIETLTLRATAFVQKLQGDGYDNVDVAGGLFNPGDPFQLSNGYNLNTYRPQPFSTLSQLYSFDGKLDLGSLTLQSITSFGKIKTNFQFDNPGNSSAVGFPWGRANTALVSFSVSSLEKFSQEFRLSSGDGAARAGQGLAWQVGAFYTHETTSYVNNYFTVDITSGAQVVTPRASAILPPGSAQVFLGTLDAKYREIAGYADLTYYFSKTFDLEAGGRVFNNDQSFANSTGGALFSPPAFRTTGPFTSNETKFTFSVAPRLHVSPESLFYARVAAGYRPGGPNPVVPAATTPLDSAVVPPSQYKSDSTINYEVGFKGNLIHRLLSVDVAAFYIDWSDVQVAASIARNVGMPSQVGFSVALNGGKAVSKGFDWALVLKPVTGLSIGWSGAFTKATLSDPITIINAPADVQLPYVPKWSHTATVDYEFPLAGSLKGNLGALYSFIGSRYSGFSTTASQSHQLIPSYDTWALSGGISTGQFGFQLYAKNLGNARGITTYSNGRVTPGGNFPGQVGLIRPREIGIRLTGKF